MLQRNVQRCLVCLLPLFLSVSVVAEPKSKEKSAPAAEAPKANLQQVVLELKETVSSQGKLIEKLQSKLSTESTQASSIKYGVIDMKQVVMSVEDGIKAQKSLKAEVAKIEKDLMSKQEELANMQKKLVQKSPLMKEKARQQQQKLLEEKYLAFKQEEMKYKVDIQKKEQEAFQTISLKVSKLVELAAEEKGLSMVVERSTSGTIYMRPPIEDLTQTIIDMYNKMTQTVVSAQK